MKTRILSLIMILILSVVRSHAEEVPAGAKLDPFDEMALKILPFFTPVKGVVNSVDGDVISSGMGTEAGIRKGMRLSVMKEGASYLHPITREVMAKTETASGAAEVIDADASGSRLRILTGGAGVGDILRLSSAKVKMLFYQMRDVGWSISEEYYGTLQDTGRFELQVTSLNTEKEDGIIAEAKRLGAEVVLILSAEETVAGTILRQRLLWTEGTKALFSSEALIEKDYAVELKLGEEYFAPPKREPFKSYGLPFNATLIAIGDINGDGTKEIVLNTGRDIVFYMPGATLKPALGGIEIKGRFGDEHIWLDAVDLNGDKKDEVLLVVINNDRVWSYAYEYKDGAFSVIGKWDFFVRAIGGRLYGQNYSRGWGYKGKVFAITAEGKRGEDAGLPEGIDLYDFIFIESAGQRLILAYDGGGSLNVHDFNGLHLWQSRDDYGGAVKTFQRESPTVMVDSGEWTVKDRLTVSGGTAYAIRRIRVSETARGMGYKHSELGALQWTGGIMKENPVIGLVSGKAVDYAVAEEGVYVLSMKMQIKNIIKGSGVMGSVLYLYPIRGLADGASR